MSYCSRCGSQIEPGSAFCGSCGAPAAGAVSHGAETAPAGQPSAAQTIGQESAIPPPMPPYGAPAMPPTPAYPAPSGGGGGGKAILFALLGLLVAGGIVVLLLGFAVGPKWFTGGGDSDQQKVVEDFMRAMEKKDAKLLISTIAPSQLEAAQPLIDYGYYDSLEEAFDELFFSEYKSMRFEGVELKTTKVKADKATVEVVKGKVTMVDADGESKTMDIKDSEMPVEFPLIREDGKWYIDFDNMS